MKIQYREDLRLPVYIAHSVILITRSTMNLHSHLISLSTSNRLCTGNDILTECNYLPMLCFQSILSIPVYYYRKSKNISRNSMDLLCLQRTASIHHCQGGRFHGKFYGLLINQFCSFRQPLNCKLAFHVAMSKLLELTGNCTAMKFRILLIKEVIINENVVKVILILISMLLFIPNYTY